MSYILDALKKSDQERKRGDVPNLQTIHIPLTNEPQTSWYLYGLISFLLLLLAFVLGAMISGKDSTEHVYVAEKNDQMVTESSEAPVLSATPGYAVEKEFGSVKKIGVNIRDTEETKEIKADRKPGQAQAVVTKIQPTQVKTSSVAPKAGPETGIPDLSDIPYLQEMADYKQQSIPEMSFAGHVYSTNPGSRSVIINGYAMSEGDAIVEGINVVEITRSGVVFSLHGELFRVDILQDWSFE